MPQKEVSEQKDIEVVVEERVIEIKEMEEQVEPTTNQIEKSIPIQETEQVEEVEQTEIEFEEELPTVSETEIKETTLIDRAYWKAYQETVSAEEFRQTLSEMEVEKGTPFTNRLFYTNTDGFVAYGFGNDSYNELLLGAKPNFQIAGSTLSFVPEVSVGFGNDISFNVLANAIKNINLNESSTEPYVGFGGGFIMPNGDFTPAINLLTGSRFENVLDGKLSTEIATRNFFQYNQIAIGYDIF